MTFEDARQAIVAYEPGSRRRRRAALKIRQDGSREYATLYLPDEVWNLERPKASAQTRKTLALREVDDLLHVWLPRQGHRRCDAASPGC